LRFFDPDPDPTDDDFAQAGSPPLRVVKKLGKVAGFVFPGMHVITAINIGASTGQGVVQKSLSDRVVKLANEEFFAPRRLVVRLCTTEAVRMLVRTGQELPKATTGVQIQKTATKIVTHLPILGKIARNFGPASMFSRPPYLRADF
jgi:hypothetical protein